MQPQLDVQVLDGRGDAACFVARRDDDRQLRRARGQRTGRRLAAESRSLDATRSSEISSQSGCRARVLEDLVEDVFGGPRRRPVPSVAGARVASSTIHGTSNGRYFEDRLDRMVAEMRPRHQALNWASDRADRRPPPTLTIARRVARRRPRSAARSAAPDPPGAGSRAPGGPCRRSRCSAAGAAQPAVDPVGEDALIGRAELSGAGEHAAAIDPDRKVERRRRIRAPAARWRAWSRRRARRAPRWKTLSSMPCAVSAGGQRRRSGPARTRRSTTRTGSAASGAMRVDAARAQHHERRADGAGSTRAR